MSTQLQKQSASLDWIAAMKNRVRESRLRALMLVNAELLSLYWDIGQEIISRQKQQGWGKKVIPQLSHELQSEFPDMQGFSTRNLGYMKRFAAAWSRESILQAPLAKLSWYHHIALLEKIELPQEREAYARLAVEQQWSRQTLVREISAGAIVNFGRSSNNFVETMPQMDAEQAIAAIRDKYNIEPQDIGQLGFYLTAVDEQVRNKDIEGETVGILLCKSRNRVVVEYALKNVRQPIAVSTYELEQMGLPSVQVLTNGLAKAIGADTTTSQ